jgi:outer membrane murein-binding lipoprotein Lpp
MLRSLAVVIGISCLTGCPSGPPVQELSDARQAIAAATTAGVTPSTSPDLYAAQAAISRAQAHLEAREYVRARLAAEAAKRHATAALNVSAHTAEAPPGSGPSVPQ